MFVSIIEMAFGIAFGLLFACAANYVINVRRRIKKTPVPHYLMAAVVVVAVFLTFTAYLVWIWGFDTRWPGTTVMANRLLMYLVYGRSSKLIFGFGIAIFFIVTYYRRSSQKVGTSSKNNQN